MDRLYLNSIQVDTPPAHTQVVPIRCDTCTKREVCSYQSDYRKVVTLIQNVLGDPQLDREVVFCDCGFTGYEFEDISIFPTTYDIKPKKEDTPITADFLNARFSSKDTVKLLVKIDDYYVLFILTYDESFSKYTAPAGRELIYGIAYELTDEALESLQKPLATWRTSMIEKEAANSEQDIINTTLFSAILNCSQYEPNQRPGVKNPNKFVNHNCDCDDRYQHIATYHKEPVQVKEATNCPTPQIGFYPWFIPVAPSCKPKNPPVRRDDQ